MHVVGAVSSPFPVWKTLKRPIGASAEYYRASYKKKGINVSVWSNEILGRINFIDGPSEVDIAKVMVKELGFNHAVSRYRVYGQAFAFGLWLLPHWAPPELRDTYDDQPKGEWLVSGTKPLYSRSHDPKLLMLNRDPKLLILSRDPTLLNVGRSDYGDRFLNSDWGSAGNTWHPRYTFLFAIPRAPSRAQYLF